MRCNTATAGEQRNRILGKPFGILWRRSESCNSYSSCMRRSSMKLTLDPATHVYTLTADDGTVSHPLSVTQVISRAGMGTDYGDVRPDILERAKQRGIHVDLACDYLDAGDLDWDSVHPTWLPYVKAWQDAKDRYRFRVIGNQRLYYLPDLHVAGCEDVDAQHLGPRGGNGNLAISIDRKTSKRRALSQWGLQTSAYARPGALVTDIGGDTLRHARHRDARWIIQ